MTQPNLEAEMDIVNLIDSPQHIPTLAQWHHQQWSYLNPHETLAQRLDRMQRHLTPGSVPSTFVAVDGSMPLGSAAIVQSDMDTHNHLSPWLASVFVAPEFRGRGVGTLLVRRVMRHAAENGFERLHLFTPDRADFYQTLGWRKVEVVEYRGVDVTVMEANTLC